MHCPVARHSCRLGKMQAGAAGSVFRSPLPKSYRTNKIKATLIIDECCTTFRNQAKCRDANEAFFVDLFTARGRFWSLKSHRMIKLEDIVPRR